MNPQAPAVTPGQPVAPLANNVNPQGTVTPQAMGAPTPSQLPTAPTPVTPPPVSAIPQQTNQLPQQLNNIADYYSIPRQTAAMVNAAQAQGANAQQATKYSTAQAGFSVETAERMLDPSSYNIVQDSSSPMGVKITNPMGEEVSLSTYNNLTGQENPVSVLENSSNPQAQQLYADYTNLENYIQTRQAADNGSVAAIQALGDYYDANPGLKNVDLGQLQSAFMNTYGQQLYGVTPGGQNLQQSIGTNNIQSAANPATQSAYEDPAYVAAQQANPYNTATQAGGSPSQMLSLLNNAGQ